jgi:hypothetical protein
MAIIWGNLEFTTKKLTNTNGKTDIMFLLVNCSKFYQQNILSLYPSINTDGNIPLVYTEKNTMGKEGIKTKSKSTMTCHLYRPINTFGKICL